MHPILACVQIKLFPRISRIFHARVIFSLVCVVFFVTNIIMSQYLPQSYENYKKELLRRPFSMNSYIRFGQALFNQGNSVAAFTQIAVATNVLGAHTELNTVLSQWDHASYARERSYDYWKQIIAIHPDYRDGYMQLAQAAYNLAYFDEAKQYVVQAQALDPNNKAITSLVSVLAWEQ